MNTLGEIKNIINNQNKLLDSYDMENIADLLISYFNLEDFFVTHDIEQINPTYDTFGNYFYYKRLIRFYVDNVILKATNIYAVNKMYEEKVNLNKFISLLLLQTLIHEISHARQHRILEEGEESFERKVIELSMITYVINKSNYINSFVKNYLNTEDNELVNKFRYQLKSYLQEENKGTLWEYKPIEREADIRSWDVARLIFEDLPDNEYILKYIDFMKSIRLLRGYDVKNEVIIPPVETYLDERKKIIRLDPYSSNTYKSLLGESINNASFEERIAYGFPITYEEGKSVAKKIKKLDIDFK